MKQAQTQIQLYLRQLVEDDHLSPEEILAGLGKLQRFLKEKLSTAIAANLNSLMFGLTAPSITDPQEINRLKAALDLVEALQSHYRDESFLMHKTDADAQLKLITHN